jgi:hypothetical protein
MEVVRKFDWLMSWFSKKNLPYWIYLGYFIAIIILGSNATEHAWAKYGILILIAPIPLAFFVLAVLAYGEWLFNMIALRQTNPQEFSNRLFIGLGKMFTLLLGLTAIGGFLWVLEPPNQWAIWEGVKVIFYLTIVSVVSFLAYRWHRQWKERKRFRKIGKAMRAAAAEVRLRKL